ncbi:MAG: hypothetical protein IT372_35655 [Polyangiaceae bacterium]|nr:hypothetical protein [Polyangiaceae bacterium]
MEVCYSGPPDTAGVGECREGTRTCEADLAGWGGCTGEVLPKVERCDQPKDENCDSFECIVWATAFEQDHSAEVADIASDSEGNALLAGYFGGTIRFGDQIFSAAGSTDAFLVKVTPKGAPVWAMQFGDLSGDGALGVATDSLGNVIVVGFTSSGGDLGGGPLAPGLVIAKLSPSGAHLWSRSVGGAGYFRDVVVDRDDDVIVVGAFSEAIDFGAGPMAPLGGMDIVVAKLSGASGSATDPGSWVRQIGAPQDQMGWAIAVDGSKNVFISGYFEGTLDPGGAAGTLVAAGIDAFVVKLSPGGNPSWSRKFGDAAEQEALAIAVDASGRPVVAGRFQGQIFTGADALTSSGGEDVFVVKYDSGGGLLWARSFGDAINQGAFGVAVDASNNILLAGYASGQINFGGGVLQPAGDLDAFAAKLSPDGAHIWSRLLGTTFEDTAWAAAVTPTSEALIGATSRADVIDFGTGPLPVPPVQVGRRLVMAKLGM